MQERLLRRDEEEDETEAKASEYDQEGQDEHIKNTIKGRQPFKRFFDEINERVVRALPVDEDDDLEPNEFYLPEVADYLLYSFMPYCFIWSGLALKGFGT